MNNPNQEPNPNPNPPQSPSGSQPPSPQQGTPPVYRDWREQRRAERLARREARWQRHGGRPYGWIWWCNPDPARFNFPSAKYGRTILDELVGALYLDPCLLVICRCPG